MSGGIAMKIKAYTPAEYAKELKQKGINQSNRTVIRKYERNLLPSNTQCKKVGGKWIIFIGFEYPPPTD